MMHGEREASVRVCPECHRQYDDTVQFCITDAAKLLIVGAPEEDPFLNLVIGGKYRVEKKIGESGMGKIYLGRHVTLGKRFAIKTLHADFTRNTEALERFRREAITTAQLEHPNILGMSDMDQMDDGTAYIVMEFLDGKEMRSLLNEVQILPVSRAVHVFAQVCRALSAAHDKGIVHRDMKPENVFLVEREGDPDFVKVLDFGISKIRMAGSKLTQTGMVIGTPHYMSPEQARGDPNLDHRSDIYTIGAMLYEALTGALPVQAENSTGVLVKILTEEPVRPTAINPQISPQLKGVIMRAMAKDPNYRFGTCREMSQALQQASGVIEGSAGYTAAGVMAGAGGFPPTSQGPGPSLPTPMRPPTGAAPMGIPPTAMTPPGSGPYGGAPGYPSPQAMPGGFPPTAGAPMAGLPTLSGRSAGVYPTDRRPWPGSSPAPRASRPPPQGLQAPALHRPGPGGRRRRVLRHLLVRHPRYRRRTAAAAAAAAVAAADAGSVVKAGSDVGSWRRRREDRERRRRRRARRRAVRRSTGPKPLPSRGGPGPDAGDDTTTVATDPTPIPMPAPSPWSTPARSTSRRRRWRSRSSPRPRAPRSSSSSPTAPRRRSAPRPASTTST